MAISPYDVKLNGLKYLVIDSQYQESPVPTTIMPFNTPGGSPEFRDNDMPAWAWWGQTLWEGEGTEDWKGDGPYYQGVGVNLVNSGAIGNAGKFTISLTDTVNTDGYLSFKANSGARLVYVGKTDGKVWYNDGAGWSAGVYTTGAAQGTTSYSFYRDVIYVGHTNGVVRTSADNGATWIASTFTAPNANPVYVLGVYKNKLWLSWKGLLKSWDGTTLADIGPGNTAVTLEGVPTTASVGTGMMFIVCQGNPSRIYIMQGDQLNEICQWPSDFLPDDSLFGDTLYISGGNLDITGGSYGEIWKVSSLGLELWYTMPIVNGTGVDYRIRSMAMTDGLVLFSWNKGCGVGVYDPTLDVYEDPQLGFYLGSRTASARTGAGRVIGIDNYKGDLYVGVSGEGVFTETAYCDFQLVSALFGAQTKRVNKMWGEAELTFVPLKVGQSITLEYSRDGGLSWALLGTVSYDAAAPTNSKGYFDFPANYLSPVLQYRVTGYGNNVELEVLDVSMSFIETSANPKRRWKFQVELYGDDQEKMLYRDGNEFERTSKQMKDELDALWNKRFAFEDIFGKTYTVVMPHPNTQLDFVLRTSEDSNPDTVTGVEARYTVNLIEV